MPEPDTAATAQTNTDGGDAATVDAYGFPTSGELSTDGMSDAELEAFVDQSLGVKSKGNSDVPTEDAKPRTSAENQTPPDVQPESPSNHPGSPKPEDAVRGDSDKEGDVAADTGQSETLDTSDLWYKVTDANGQEVTLKLDDGIPDDFLFASDKQLFEVLDSFQEMKALKAERESKIEKVVAEKAAAEADQKTQQSTMAGWANEIDDLIEAGLIDKTDAQPADGKAYSAAEIAANPGLQTTSQVFDYMKTENTKRAAAGRAPLTSFAAAFSLYKKATDTSAEVEALPSPRMCSTIASPAANDKGYVYKRGSARNVWQVDTSDI